jgi:exopolysaccharide biosynthesis polyprenyl glycosylphosphotransferase
VLYVDAVSVSRLILAMMLIIASILIIGERMILKIVRDSLISEGSQGRHRVVILGTGPQARDIARRIAAAKFKKYNLLGFIEVSSLDSNIAVDRDSIVGTLDKLHKIVKEQGVNEVIIAFSSYTFGLHKHIEKIVRDYSELNLRFRISPHLYEGLVGHMKLRGAADFLLYDVHPQGIDYRYLFLKRLIDIVVSFTGLVLLSPFLLIVALIIKLNDGGSVLYKQRRLGRFGREFTLYKFRTMVPEAEKETGPVWASSHDTRVTPLGRFLRSYSIDELLQLWNVLRGDISLVGPRPERPYFVKKHKELSGKRLNVKPGITGLAQVNGRYNLSARHKAKYDFIYLKNCSLGLDFKVMLQTIWVVLSREGVR